MAGASTKDDLLELARQHIEAGRFDKALAEYQKLARQDPDDLRMLLRIAELHVKLKQVQQAIVLYREVAVRYTDEGFYLKAVAVYKSTLRLNPALREANLALGELYEKMGLGQDAVHQYQILLRYHDQKGQTDKALELRRRIVALDPGNITNRVRLAEAFQLQGDEEASLREYEVLAEQLQERGSETQLLELYEKILNRRPDHLEILKRLCRIYEAKQDWRKVLHWLTAGAVVVAKEPGLLRLLASVLARLNQMESARSKWRDLARLNAALGDESGAHAAYEELLILAPEEDAELRDEIESLGTGTYTQLFSRAQARRDEQAQRDAEAETLAVAREEALSRIREEEARQPKAVSPPVAGTAPQSAAAPSITPVEQEAAQQSAAGCVSLGDAYLQMGMQTEARQEYGKAVHWYRQLVASGAGDAAMVTELKRLEALVSGPSPSQ